MSISPKKLFIITIAFVGIIFTLSKIKHYVIDKNYVYVLAKLVAVNDSGDGKSFVFSYKYENQFYEKRITSLEILTQKSLVLFKISVDHPSWIELLDEKIPDCFVDDKYLGTEWKEFPRCK